MCTHKTLVHTRTQGNKQWHPQETEPGLPLSVWGMGQQWPAMGTGALAGADLGGAACGISSVGGVAISVTIELPSRWPTNWRTIIPKKFSHFCKNSRAQIDFPAWRFWQRDWEPLGNLTLKTSGIWLQNFHSTGKMTFGRHKQSLVCTRTQDKGAVTLQETEAGLPVSVQKSLVEVWVKSGALNTTVLGASVCWHKSFCRRLPLPLL